MLAIGALAIAMAIIATLLFLLSQADGLLLANGQPVFGDYISFWSAGRAALEGHAARVYDADFLFGYHQAAVPGVAYVAPFNSPPPFLLLNTALAALPFPLAALTFLTSSAALYVYAARKLGPGALIFALTLPAAVYHLGSVQTGLYIAGVSALALHWLDARPRAAGALVGLLAIKPHLAILWPLLLALTGRWRAFAAATVSTLVFCVLAGALLGFELYPAFIENLTRSQAQVSEMRITTPAYASLYAGLLGLGASQDLAIAAHAVSAVAALALAAWLFLRGGRETQGPALCAATLLISPYLFFYDFTLLAAGAALIGAPRDRFELAAIVLAWGAALSLPLGYVATLPLCPLAAWFVLIAAMRRAGTAAPRPAPAPHR